MAAALVAAGAAFGALAGVLTPRPAYRLSVRRGSPPRPACHRCAAPFPAGPTGWLRLGSRCPVCRVRQGPPGWVTAGAGALSSGVLAWALPPATVAGGRAVEGGRAVAGGSLVLVAFLIAAVAGVLLAAIDMACLRLPDTIVGLATAASVLLLGVAAAVIGTSAAMHDLLRALAGALTLSGGYLVLALLPGANLGMGDVKLCALLGLLLGWLGWGAVLLGALLPHLINGPVALGLLLTRRAGRKTEVPLGPALLAGGLLAVAAHAIARR